MPKPSTIITWATDAGATADPGPTRRATGFIAGKKLPSKWLNWLLSQNAAWLTYLRDLHNEPEFLGQNYAWTGTHTFGTRYVRKLWPLTAFRIALNSGTPNARTTFAETPSFIYQGVDMFAGGVQATTILDLPLGSTLASVRVGVKSTGAGSSYPMSCTLQRVTPDLTGAGPNVLTTSITDAATPGAYDVIGWPALSASIDANSWLYLLVNGGTDATSMDRDRLQWVEIIYGTAHADPNL